MRIAFVDPLPVAGGLSRFVFLLLKNIAQQYPQCKIDYFVHAYNITHDTDLRSLSKDGVNIIELQATKPKAFLVQKVTNLYEKLTSRQLFRDVAMEVQKKVVGYDVVYFSSAHMMEYIKLTMP